MLAHELRNPLAPIRNAVHLMKMKTLEESQLRLSRDIIERQLAQLTRLVDDLLDVSRITRGKITWRGNGFGSGTSWAARCKPWNRPLRRANTPLRLRSATPGWPSMAMARG